VWRGPRAAKVVAAERSRGRLARERRRQPPENNLPRVGKRSER
jgi:hypothetical protein